MLYEYELKVSNTPLTGTKRFMAEKNYIHEKRNAMECCPYCHSNIKDRKIALYKELINSLYAVYRWLGEHKKHEFHIHEIKHLLSKNDYARFSDLVKFGGIVYRPLVDKEKEGGVYGMNMGRAKKFFRGESSIPIQITIDQITGETIKVDSQGFINDFPQLSKLIKANGLYDHEIPVQQAIFK